MRVPRRETRPMRAQRQKSSPPRILQTLTLNRTSLPRRIGECSDRVFIVHLALRGTPSLAYCVRQRRWQNWQRLHFLDGADFSNEERLFGLRNRTAPNVRALGAIYKFEFCLTPPPPLTLHAVSHHVVLIASKR
jgi:hypothetical protein